MMTRRKRAIKGGRQTRNDEDDEIYLKKKPRK